MFILLLLILSPFTLFSEQLVRSRWDYGGASSLLYRISDERALAELSLRWNPDDTEGMEEGELLPARVIFETDFLKFGSYRPAGLWKFTAMDDLAPVRELRKASGAEADRSSEKSLERPLFSLYREGRGGLFVQSSQEWMYTGLWGWFDMGEYRSFQTAGSLYFPDPAVPDREEAEWFCGADESRYAPVYHLAGDFRQEMPASRLSFTAAVSGTSDSPWGASLLPSFDLFSRFVDWRIRFWYNTAYWINSRGTRPEWRECLENSFRIYAAPGLRLDLVWEIRTDRYASSPPYNTVDLASCYERGYWEFRTDYSLLPPPVSGEVLYYSHGVCLSVSRRKGMLTLRGEGGGSADRLGVSELFASAGIRCRLGFSTTAMTIDYKEIPGRAVVKPVLEESLRLGQFTVSGRASAELVWPELLNADPDTIVLTLTGEWRSGRGGK